MTKYCINCINIEHPCRCQHCDEGDEYKQSIDSKNFEKEVRKNERDELLDKIRAEIEKLKPNNPNFKGYFQQNVALNKALGVIDKYKAESEENGYDSRRAY